MASFIPWGNQFYTIIRTQLVADIETSSQLIRGADVLLLQLEIPVDASMAAARIAREGGVTVILNPAPYQELPTAFLELVDVIVPNEVEFAGLTGLNPDDLGTLKGASRQLMEKGPEVVIVRWPVSWG